MRTTALAIFALLSFSAAAYADEDWTARSTHGNISCKAETIQDSPFELITAQRGNIFSVGRHIPRSPEYEWRRSMNLNDKSHSTVDLVTPCGTARPKGA